MLTFDFSFQNNKLVADLLLSMLTVSEQKANFGIRLLKNSEDF